MAARGVHLPDGRVCCVYVFGGGPCLLGGLPRNSARRRSRTCRSATGLLGLSEWRITAAGCSITQQTPAAAHTGERGPRRPARIYFLHLLPAMIFSHVFHFSVAPKPLEISPALCEAAAGARTCD